MNSETFSWQNGQGQKVYAQEWKPDGDVQGVVALVHGLGEHIGRYKYVAQALNQAKFAVIGFDLSGHGQTEGKRGHASYDEILQDIDRLLEEASQRYPGKPRFLYGHSLGGALVLYYTLQRKPEVNGVIATSPGLATGTPVPSSKLFLAKVMSRIAPSFTMSNGLDLNNLSHDQTVKEAYQNDPLVHSQISARLGLDLLTKGEWIQSHAGEFPVPLLLIQGTADRLVSPQATTSFAAAVPQERITYKEWPGLYHETHNEFEKQQVLWFIIDWLRQHV